MRWRGLVGPLLLLLAWSASAHYRLIDPFFFPEPLTTLRALARMLAHGTARDVQATVLKTVWAFCLAVAAGVPAGLMLGSSPRAYRSVEFLVDLFRSIPPTAMFPLFLLLFGIGDAGKISVAAFSSGVIVLFNTAYGVLNASQARIRAAKLMGAGRLAVFRHVIFWESLPQTFVGLRTALSFCLLVIIVTEMFIGSSVGVGRAIIDAQITYDIPGLYAMILLAGLIGYALNRLLALAERRLVRWS